MWQGIWRTGFFILAVVRLICEIHASSVEVKSPPAISESVHYVQQSIRESISWMQVMFLQMQLQRLRSQEPTEVPLGSQIGTRRIVPVTASRHRMSHLQSNGRVRELREYRVDLIEYNRTYRRYGVVNNLVFFWRWNAERADYDLEGWREQSRVIISPDRRVVESLWDQEYVIVGDLIKDSVSIQFDPEEQLRQRIPGLVQTSVIPWDRGIYTCVPDCLK